MFDGMPGAALALTAVAGCLAAFRLRPSGRAGADHPGYRKGVRRVAAGLLLVAVAFAVDLAPGAGGDGAPEAVLMLGLALTAGGILAARGRS